METGIKMRDVIFPRGTQTSDEAHGYAAALRSGGFLLRIKAIAKLGSFTMRVA